jgi:hypothetical protein
MKYIIETPQWTYIGHIPIDTSKIGITVPFTNTMYYRKDLSEVDPEYRLYLLGYGIKGQIIKMYPDKNNSFINVLKSALNGYCYCCLCHNDTEICELCKEEFSKCSIKIL